MDLVGRYGSSDEEHDGHTVTPQQTIAAPASTSCAVQGDAKGKGKLSAKNSTNKPTNRKKRPSEGKRHGTGKRGGGKEARRRRQKVTKVINALVLSPEIQAALARGDTLGDSDSDYAPGEKTPKKLSVKPSSGDPSDLLSMLPQPTSAASADHILFQSQQKRREAATAKTMTVGVSESRDAPHATARIASTSARNSLVPTGAAPTTRSIDLGSGVDSNTPKYEESDFEGDCDGSDADQLESNMPEKSPLFSFPSRSRLKSPTAVSDHLPPVQTSGIEPGNPGDTILEPATQAEDNASSEIEARGRARVETGEVELSRGREWVGAEFSLDEGHSFSGAALGVAEVHRQHERPEKIYQAEHGQGQPPEPPLYCAGAPYKRAEAQYQSAAALDVSGVAVGERGAKASRRRGRDIERALAGGNLGAIGNEKVMNLHQGTNEYNLLRAKPITAAIQQETTHVEGSVYDPKTGKTVTTLEPTSTQKRKHQINQLAVQAASMQRDLMERSGASRLTKAQTHAKYGW